MKCPIDRQPLEKSIYEGEVEIDSCSVCNGIWLDKGELESIQQIRENNYDLELDERSLMSSHITSAYQLGKKTADRELTCPSCQNTMIQKEYGYASLIMIDICPNITCQGIWLDHGELQALEIYYENSRREQKKHETKDFISSLIALF